LKLVIEKFKALNQLLEILCPFRVINLKFLEIFICILDGALNRRNHIITRYQSAKLFLDYGSHSIDSFESDGNAVKLSQRKEGALKFLQIFEAQIIMRGESLLDTVNP
jgi:hypothetical protein